MTTTNALTTAEYRLRRADGDYLHILDCVHDSQGLPVRMVGATKDILAQRVCTGLVE